MPGDDRIIVPEMLNSKGIPRDERVPGWPVGRDAEEDAMDRRAASRVPGPNPDAESSDPALGSRETTTVPLSPAHPNDNEGPRSEPPRPSDLQARQLRETATSCYLYGASAGVFPAVEAAAYTAYLEQLLRDAGDPSDPIERMLVEQLVQAHHAVGRLYFRASNSETVDAAGVYLAAAARLMNEFRKTSLALRIYRTPAVAPNVTVTQNIASEQKIAVIGGGSSHGDRPVLPNRNREPED